MASNTVILLAWSLIVAGVSADFVVHMDPCEVNAGDAVLITCHVINEDPYGPAWAWFRFSADGTHEIIGKREMMMNAYLEERGYSLDDPVRNAEYDGEGVEVLYNLHIPAAELEDNAEFGCGRTHEEATKEALHVRTAPSEIFLYGNKNPLTPESLDGSLVPFPHNELLHITPDSRGHFICSAEGFIPAPELTLTFNGTTLKHLTATATTTSVTSATNPAYVYNVHNAYTASSQHLDMNTDANRLPLTCTATSSALAEPLVKTVRPVLRVAPILNCDDGDKKVPSGAKNVKLTCVLEADPDCETVEWTWTDRKGKKLNHTLNSGDTYINSKFSSSHEVLEDGRIETSMVFSVVHPNMFNTYTIRAVNEIGEATSSVKLIRNYAAEPDPEDDKVSGCASTLPSLLLITAAVLSVFRLL